ncbi:MAG TPA: S-methyl-5'-thioadenosine phosphorylase [Blastocatellia bacterium]|nr:S-methyl-5'-thioadenosine phosphorylase [Blastocatellia bacterium]
MSQAAIGVIGGSGIYQMESLRDVEEVSVDTPFGKPSDDFIIGTLEGVRVAFLPRHARGHKLLPTDIPFRANIYAMKLLGVERILSASAVGSLKEELRPMDIVLPDQFFDRTSHRHSTFFGDGVVAHVGFADPVCAALCDLLADSASTDLPGVTLHRGGTYICMEGPAFSTRAESEVYRSWGMSVIGMTNLQEAKLAREAEICYATIALVTDYDCWHPEHDSVTVEMIIDYLNRNAVNAQKLITRTVAKLASSNRDCKCRHSLRHAIITAPDKIPPEARVKLQAIIGKYVHSSE